MSAHSYDLVVIGAGPAGEVGAIRAAQLGLRVALVEKSPHLGGTCLNVGCIPTKALLGSAATYQKLQQASEDGFTLGGDVRYDWARIQDRKGQVVDQQRKGLRFLMKKNKVDTYEGLGSFLAKDKIHVSLTDKGEAVLQTRFVLIATGSKVRALPSAPVDGKVVHSSDTFLAIDHVPKALAVIGGGVVGMEFASCFARFGSQVTVIEAGPQILPTEDEAVVKDLTRYFTQKNGMTLRTKTSLQSCQVLGGAKGAQLTFGDGSKGTFDTVLVSIGREPMTDGLALDHIGIKTEKGFVTVDKNYRTQIPTIFAVGDVIPTPMLAHTASAEAIHAVEIMAGHHPAEIDYLANPNAIYTYPEVASIGYTEQKLRDLKKPYKSAQFPFAPMAKAKIDHATEGFVKILFDPEFRGILGVHILGAKATEMISEFVLGKILETTVDEIGHAIHPHPTLSETVMEAAHAAMGGAIHM